jgi:hypothetical protein
MGGGEMTKEELLQELSDYKTNVYFLKRNVFDRDEMIESIALSAPGFSPVPPSVTNKFSSKVENAVFRIEQEEREYSDGIRRIARSVANVNFLIDSLNMDQRFIIEAKYVKEYKTWVDIAREYQRFKDINFISVSTIKKIRDQSLDRMLETMNKYNQI